MDSGPACVMLDFDAPPSTLYALWPWPEPPTFVEIEYRIGGEIDRSEAPDASTASVLWVEAFRLPEFRVPVLVWASAIEELPATVDLGDVHWDEGEREHAESSRWLIGIETFLDPNNPTSSYQAQLHLCRTICPESPAIYDASSDCLRSGSLVDRLTSTEIPPRSSELFRIHAVRSDDSDGICWLHSHGLARAGFPDVEMLDVPADLFRAGAWLLRNFVDRFLDDKLPEPSTPFEIGHELSISWKPYEEIIASKPADALGGREDREPGADDPDDPDHDDEHGGARIVLVDSKPTGWLKKHWGPPLTILERVESEGAIASISHQETKRMSLLARERWHELGMLFARHGRTEDWTFLVKLGYQVDGGEAHEREHLWFEVREIAPNRLRGKLLNKPLQIGWLEEDQEDWHELDMLTDWKIFSPLGEFSPENVRYVQGGSHEQN